MIKLYILTTLVLLSFVSNSQSTLNINKGQANPTTTNGNVSEFGVSNQGDWILTWTYDESRCFLTNSNGNITSSTFDPYIYIVFKNIASNKDSFSLHVQGHKRGLMQLHYGFLSMPGFELIMPAPIFSHGTSLNIPCYDNSAVQISLNSYINTSGLSEGLTITSDFEWTIPSGWITADNQSGTFVAGPSISVIPPYSTNNTQITVRAKASSQYSNATTLQITRNIGSIYISGNSVVNCGQTYQFSAPFYNNVSYSWQLPNGWTGASSTNTINATVNGAKGNVILTVSACNQVSRDTFNVSDIKIFPDNAYLSGYTVNILCEPGINITAGNLFPNSYLTWTTSSNIVASNSSPSTFI